MARRKTRNWLPCFASALISVGVPASTGIDEEDVSRQLSRLYARRSSAFLRKNVRSYLEVCAPEYMETTGTERRTKSEVADGYRRLFRTFEPTESQEALSAIRYLGGGKYLADCRGTFQGFDGKKKLRAWREKSADTWFLGEHGWQLIERRVHRKLESPRREEPIAGNE